MIEITLKFESPATADSFASWFQEKGAEQFFKTEPTANSLDSEGRTFFLTAQEKPDVDLADTPIPTKSTDKTGLEGVTTGRSSVTDIREENKGKEADVAGETPSKGKANEADTKQVSETKTEAVKAQSKK